MFTSQYNYGEALNLNDLGLGVDFSKDLLQLLIVNGGTWQAKVHGVAKSRARQSDFTFPFHFHALEKEMATPPVFLPGESQGWRSLVGCRLWGRTESDTTEAT